MTMYIICYEMYLPIVWHIKCTIFAVLAPTDQHLDQAVSNLYEHQVLGQKVYLTVLMYEMHFQLTSLKVKWVYVMGCLSCLHLAAFGFRQKHRILRNQWTNEIETSNIFIPLIDNISVASRGSNLILWPLHRPAFNFTYNAISCCRTET